MHTVHKENTMEDQEIKILRGTQPKYIVRAFKTLEELEVTANSVWRAYEIDSMSVAPDSIYIVVFSRNDD